MDDFDIRAYLNDDELFLVVNKTIKVAVELLDGGELDNEKF